MPLTRVLLLPFSWLYGLIAFLRNFLYDSGIWKSYSFRPAVISVGNLSVGGTGKSPMIEYLALLLSARWEVAILSRGYKRISSGFRLATDTDDARTLGDEPYQFYRKLGKKIRVAVCADRVQGITKILQTEPQVEVILLDDAFQHRRVKPLFSILLTELNAPFYKDFVLPAGRLREPRAGCARADVVVVTKCNGMTGPEEQQARALLAPYGKDVFFSQIEYQTPVALDEGTALANEIQVVTGIANPEPLIRHLSATFRIKKHFSFPDHHAFTLNDIATIQRSTLPV